MLGVFGDIIFLQQPCVLFMGVQGIDLQHCISCWFDIGSAMQDCTCRNRIAAAAIATNNRFAVISR